MLPDTLTGHVVARLPLAGHRLAVVYRIPGLHQWLLARHGVLRNVSPTAICSTCAAQRSNYRGRHLMTRSFTAPNRISFPQPEMWGLGQAPLVSCAPGVASPLSSCQLGIVEAYGS